MSQVLSLFRLQTIDTEKDHILARLRKIEEILLENEALKQAFADKTSAEKELSTAQQTLKHAEDAVKSQKIKIELEESSLYGGKVRSPKELQDLQSEVESLKRFLGVLEERQLDAMLVLDDKENLHHASLAGLQAIEQELAQKHAALFSEKEQLQHTLERIEAERKVASAPISTETIALYNHLRVQKRGVAVARIDDCACEGCGSELTPGECQAAKSLSLIRTCPSCGRILYAG